MKTTAININTYLFLLYCCLFLSVTGYAQEKNGHCTTVRRIVAAMNKQHFSPIEYNDKVSAAIFKQFIDELDPYQLYLTSEDRDLLFLYQYKLDDEINNEQCEFIGKVIERYHQGISRAQAIVDHIAITPFDLSTTDTLEYIPNYDLDDIGAEQLKDRWRKWLKYKVISRLFSPNAVQPKPYQVKSDILAQKEAEIRKAVCLKEQKLLHEKINSLGEVSNFVTDLFFNAIAHQYDPHSDFFSISDKQIFETLLSDENLSFGFEIIENTEGNVEIISLVPGGPAWKSNNLHKGDVLQRLKLADGTEFDLTLITLDRMDRIFKKIEKEEVVLTVRKVSGQVKSVTLVKEVIRNDENAINSFVLSGERKMGYISLPSFYTEMENESMLGCANDFAKELIGLNREGIEGLVIDLRNNGGGSVKEAIDLAGIFIDAGPLFVSSDQEGTLSVLKDPNRGTIYDGPVVILLNKLSASASEIFASTLQDYNRAVIVGGASYGKSTGQLILPLLEEEDYKRLNFWDIESDFGFIKVTTSKFYRISGKTHQLTGVIPDIHLPQMMEGFDFGEHSYPTALSSDSINKKLYLRLLPKLPMSRLQAKNQQRLSAHPNFQEIDQVKSRVGKVWAIPEKTLIIGMEAYRDYQKQVAELSEKWEQLSERDIDDFLVELSNYDKEIVAADTQIKAIYEIRKRQLSRDIYVEEAFNILMDLIFLQTK